MLSYSISGGSLGATEAEMKAFRTECANALPGFGYGSGEQEKVKICSEARARGVSLKDAFTILQVEEKKRAVATGLPRATQRCTEAGVPPQYIAQCATLVARGSSLTKAFATIQSGSAEGTEPLPAAPGATPAVTPGITPGITPDAFTVSQEFALEKPWYKKPLVLAAIGGGVLAVGGGAYFMMRGR
jgi:hypothetical protein